MASWPIGIPQVPTTAGQQVAGPTENNILATQMSVGPGKRRQRSTKTNRMVKLDFHGFNVAQVDIFEAWFRVTLANGSLSFVMIDPIADTQIYNTYRFDPKAPYVFSAWGTKYVLSVNLQDIT